jgi:hypothetical protein
MDSYVTPDRFRAMNFGLDLESYTEYELRSVLRRASSRVNAIAAVPGLPQPHDFRGGSITNEEHDWRMGDGVSTQDQRTIFLWHTPIKTVTDLRIRLTNQQGIVFDPGEIYVSKNAVEIVSLAMTSVGLFGSFVVPQVGLSKPKVSASYTYGYSVPVTNQTLDATDGRTFCGQDQWWDETEEVHVYDEAGAEVTTGFTIDHDEGAVTFDTNQDPDVTFKASFVTKLPPGIADATGILAAESIGNHELRERGMSGLRSIRVGEIEIQKDIQSRGATTTISPAVMEATTLIDPYRFLWAGA